MVFNMKPQNFTLLRKTRNRNSSGGAASAPHPHAGRFVVKATREYEPGNSSGRPIPEDEADDVIDLGAPRLPRRAQTSSPGRQRRLHSYTPNPRLYPGPPKKPEPKKSKRVEARGRRRKRVYKRPVPNARLYRPAPPRPRPPPPSPWRGGRWPPPAPTQPALATASLAALQLSETRPESAAAPPPPPSRRLVVTLPAQRNTMDHAPRNSEEGSDGNDPLSAPSEFLAEFLSAIMQRQYSEALKYCRLILQYEPHNATARGFYSLLQHKVSAAPAAAPPTPPTPPSSAGHSPGYAVNLNFEPRGSSSADSSSPRRAPARRRRQSRFAVVDVAMGSSHEGMQQEADESTSSSSGSDGAAGAGAGAGARRDASPTRSDSGSESDDSCASQSSLELDSSPSLSLSRRTDHTDSASGSGAGWPSSGTPPSGGSAPPDDNGNAPPTPEPTVSLHAEDMQNYNDHTSPLKSESSSETLRRLRAQFACSIK